MAPAGVRRVYCAGPMTGRESHNYPAFHAAAASIRALGYEVCNPAELNPEAEHMPPERCQPWAYYLRRDLSAMLNCDAVAVLPGWQKSRGARLEVHVARQLGMPVLDADTLEPWGQDPREWRGMLVGVAGFARTGKDTLVQQIGWPRAAFADELKADLHTAVTGLGLDVNDPAHKEMARPLMVEYGRLGRKANPDVWISRLFLPPVRAAIADLRYVNEARWVIRQGGLVVRLHREGYGPANEEEAESFAELDEYLGQEGSGCRAVAHVYNRGTAEDLGKSAEEAIASFFWRELKVAV